MTDAGQTAKSDDHKSMQEGCSPALQGENMRREAAEHSHREAKMCFRAFARSDNEQEQSTAARRAERGKHCEIVDTKPLTKKMRRGSRKFTSGSLRIERFYDFSRGRA